MISDVLQTVCKLSLHFQYFFIFKYHFKLIEKQYSKTLLVETGCNNTSNLFYTVATYYIDICVC